MLARAVVAGTVVAASALFGIACQDNDCLAGQTRLPVQPTRESLKDPEYVCIDQGTGNPATDAGAATPAANNAGGTIGGASSSSGGDATEPEPVDDGGADGASPVCGAPGSVGTLAVHVLTENGALPIPPPAVVPDGTYVLGQATWRPSDAGAPPFRDLRAELAVVGARLTLTADASAGVDAATGTAAGGVLTTVCVMGDGSAAAELFPPIGISRAAEIGWDGDTLGLVLHLPTGDLALAFFRP